MDKVKCYNVHVIICQIKEYAHVVTNYLIAGNIGR